MDDKLVDYSFLEELSGGDPQYKYDVIGIFLDTMNDGMSNLEQLVAGDDYEAIEKQSHALKSSAGIVKVRGMYDHLRRMEELVKARRKYRRDLVRFIKHIKKQSLF